MSTSTPPLEATLTLRNANLKLSWDPNNLIFRSGVAYPRIVHVKSTDSEFTQLEMTIEIQNGGAPAVTNVSLTSSQGGARVTPSLLRILAGSLEEYAISLPAAAAYEYQKKADGEIVITHTSARVKAEKVFRAAKSRIEKDSKGARRRLTKNQLDDMARIYNSVSTRGAQEIAAAYTVSIPQAYRYVSKLRELGLIEERRVVRASQPR